MSEPALLTSAQVASFVARGFLRFEAAVPADINAQFLAEAGQVAEPASGAKLGRVRRCRPGRRSRKPIRPAARSAGSWTCRSSAA